MAMLLSPEPNRTMSRSFFSSSPDLIDLIRQSI